MKVGDKVVCIRSRYNGLWWNEFDECVPGPKLDDVLNITRVDEDGGLCFKEFHAPVNDGYNPTAFRKIEPFKNKLTQELAIQVLTEQLKPEIEHIEIKEKETV